MAEKGNWSVLQRGSVSKVSGAASPRANPEKLLQRSKSGSISKIVANNNDETSKMSFSPSGQNENSTIDRKNSELDRPTSAQLAFKAVKAPLSLDEMKEYLKHHQLLFKQKSTRYTTELYDCTYQVS